MGSREKVFSNVSRAFKKFYNSLATNITLIVENALNITAGFVNDEAMYGDIIFASDEKAVAYIYWAENTIKFNNEDYTDKPLNNNDYFDLNDDDFLVYPTYDRSYNKKKNSELPKTQYFKKFIFIQKKYKRNIDNVYISNTSEFVRSGEFKIAYIPIGNEFKINNIHSNDSCCSDNPHQRKFFIQGDNGENLKYRNSLIHALSKNYSMIFSCEIAGSLTIDNYVSEYYDLNKTLFISSPSYHSLESEVYQNKSQVYYYDNSANLRSKYVIKSEQFFLTNEKYEKYFIEDIKNVTPKFLLFHLKEIGTVLLVICKDVLTSLFERIIKNVNPNITLIIAYSKDYTEFNDKTKEITSNGNIVIVGNCCEACLEKNDIIYPTCGFYYGGKNMENEGLENSSRIKTKNAPCDKKMCENAQYCYFVFNIKCNLDKGYSIKKIEKIFK